MRASTRLQVRGCAGGFSTLKLLLFGLAASQIRSWRCTAIECAIGMTSHGLAASGDWSESDQPSEDRQPLTISRRRNRIMDAGSSEFDRVRSEVGPLYGYALLSGKRDARSLCRYIVPDASDPQHHQSRLRHRAYPSQFAPGSCYSWGLLHGIVCSPSSPVRETN